MPMFHFLRSTVPAVVAAMASTHGSFESRGPWRAVPVAGTQVVFEPQAELTGQSFYDLPYPFDVRLNAQGGPDLSGMPTNGADAALDLIPAAGDRAGFPTVPVGYFRLTGAPAPHALDEVMPAEEGAAVLLLDVDPLSPDRGTLSPSIATVIPAGAYAPENLLAVAAAPGLVLPAGREYAFVLRRSYGDQAGQPLGVSLDLRSLGLMGQSMGAQYANLLAAVEPAVQTLVPSGSGGPWNKFLVESKFNFGATTAVDIMASLFSVPREELSPLHPTINLVETAWEPGEPLVSAARVGRRPLPGHPVRQIYQPVGLDDEFFPPTIFDAMALGPGVEQAGDVFWSSLQTSLALEGYDGLVDYPVARNTTSAKGVPRTGVVVQYLGDGIADPHTIFSQLDEVKYQYGCFFATHAHTGRAVVPAPAPLGTPCPE
jgi:hypothetical protein